MFNINISSAHNVPILVYVTYVQMYICTYVYMYICIFVYMYICIYVYMYICIYMYIYIHCIVFMLAGSGGKPDKIFHCFCWCGVGGWGGGGTTERHVLCGAPSFPCKNSKFG